ncbi:leucine-rich repeat domain-containing protein, partial [Aquimarina sp. AU119]|uniref:leucine-rich repeat domain-containing protein n=1 Tax=Aquimarina sp. AU119 TaxID=2108528 RepID=UPI001358F10B
MKKQLKLTMSAVVMVLVSLTTYGQNVGKQFTVDDIRYKITAIAPPEVMIVVYEGTATEVEIPETVDDNGKTYTVTAIGENTDTFHGGLIRPFFEKGLTHVKIPNTVTIIGLGAFNTNNLTEVDIPNSVTHIRRWGFSGNFLKELTIPANVEYIGPQAFFGLKNIPIVRSERNPPPEIDETAFDTPSGPHFRKMDLVVPFIAIQAYEDAGWKEDFGFVSITSGVTTVDKVKYGLVDSPGAATLIADVGVPFHLIIPSEVDIGGNSYPVTAIGDGAFVSTERALLTVIIPESVKSIGEKAFYVRRINHIIMLSDDPPALDADAFE